MPKGVIDAVWSAPHGVHAFTTTRLNGFSPEPYASLNLGDHVDDQFNNVKRNRDYLRSKLSVPSEPIWLTQVHGQGVLDLDQDTLQLNADAAVTRQANRVCAVLTADCLPVVFSHIDGGCVAAAHAGWRGLHSGVLEATVARMGGSAGEIVAWMGAAIGPSAFQVGQEVFDAFSQEDSSTLSAFVEDGRGHWKADLYALARIRLARCGVTDVSGGEHCTYTEEDLFFSYRRSKVTGRQATLIWFDET